MYNIYIYIHMCVCTYLFGGAILRAACGHAKDSASRPAANMATNNAAV